MLAAEETTVPVAVHGDLGMHNGMQPEISMIQTGAGRRRLTASALRRTALS
jgi:hypothetical protein